MLSDVSFALRTLRRRRGFSAVAIATIALGIGAATSIYSVVDGVLFRPLPFADAGRLVAIWQTFPQFRTDPILSASWDRITLSLPELRDLRATQTTFTDVGVWADYGYLLGGSDRPEQVRVINASASLLSVLRATPALGRNFTEDEDVVGGAPVTMLSYETWQARYQFRRDIVGQTVLLDNQPYTIVGVLPPGLSLSRIGAAASLVPFWVPVGRDSLASRDRNNRSFMTLGRLKPGVAMNLASVETERILRGNDRTDSKGARLQGWQEDQTRDVRKPLLLLFSAAGLLLLIACVNVAILLLGEASGRELEMAARIALGASRSRILTQLLTESVVLSSLGALVGTALAWGGTRLLMALAPPRIPGISGVAVDVRVLGFALITCLATGIIFGLAPALNLARSAPGQVSRDSSGQSVSGRGTLQRTLIAVELALSLVMLVGAGLLTRSFTKLTAVSPGFRPDSLLVVRVAVPAMKYPDSSARRQFRIAAAERLRAIPGARAVTGTSNVPFDGSISASPVEIEGRPVSRTVAGPRAQQRITLPGYFDVMGIPVKAGRTYTTDDHAGGPPVIVISETMARREWPQQSSIGRHIRFRGTWREVIGVVGDTKYSKLSAEDQATIYLPIAQYAAPSMSFVIRTAGDPASVIGGVRDAFFELEPMAPVLSTERMTDMIRRSSAEERYRTFLISLFSVIAGLLAAIGLYGVTSGAVRRRRREMGIRVALGATPGGIIAHVLRYTFAGLALGVVGGLVASLAASRALEPFLFGVNPTDAVSYAGSVALLLVVSLVASWVPARRASRVPAADALRAD